MGLYVTSFDYGSGRTFRPVMAAAHALRPAMAHFRPQSCASDGYGTRFFAFGELRSSLDFKFPVQRLDAQTS